MVMNQKQAAPTEDAGRSQDGVETLKDPILKRVIDEDPLVRFVYTWRTQIMWILALALCIGYVRYYLRQSHQESMKRGADVYAEMRGEFNQIDALRRQLDRTRDDLGKLKEDAADKKKELAQKSEGLEKDLKEAEAKFSGKLAALGDQKEPYNLIAGEYKTLMAVRADEALKLSDSLPALDGTTLAKEGAARRFFTELKALLIGRSLLDKPDTYQKGAKILQQLAESGGFVGVSAALTLARVAEGDAERAKALAALETVMKQQPEQASLVEEEIERLKS
jgi:hypothetical protein